MVPDWIILTEQGYYIVEYFGLYEVNQQQNTRVKDYIVRTHEKIEKYRNMPFYKYLFLYPNDIVNDFNGVRDKLSKMRENVDFTMI